MKHLVVASGLLAAAVYTLPANAALIASFSQNPSLIPTVNATDNGTTTNITVQDASTNVSTGSFTGNVLFDLNATSIDAATTVSGAVIQHYSGNFCFSSTAGCSGTNYLSGNFTDAAFGGVNGPGLVLNVNNPPDTLTLTSDVLTNDQLQPPSTFGLTFADLTPTLHIDGSTIAAFTADFAGEVSSSTVTNTPEPASLFVLGASLLGLGCVRLRKQKRDNLI